MSQINEILDNIKLPQIMKVSQTFDNTKLDDVEGDLNQKLIDKNILVIKHYVVHHLIYQEYQQLIQYHML